jgi:hypothetical protein
VQREQKQRQRGGTSIVDSKIAVLTYSERITPSPPGSYSTVKSSGVTAAGIAHARTNTCPTPLPRPNATAAIEKTGRIASVSAVTNDTAGVRSVRY